MYGRVGRVGGGARCLGRSRAWGAYGGRQLQTATEKTRRRLLPGESMPNVFLVSQIEVLDYM